MENVIKVHTEKNAQHTINRRENPYSVAFTALVRTDVKQDQVKCNYIEANWVNIWFPTPFITFKEKLVIVLVRHKFHCFDFFLFSVALKYFFLTVTINKYNKCLISTPFRNGEKNQNSSNCLKNETADKIWEEWLETQSN